MIETEKKRLYNMEPTQNKSMPHNKTEASAQEQEAKKQSIRLIDTNVLAYMGDAVYEAYIRNRVIGENPRQRAGSLHKLSVHYVKSEAQAAAIKGLEDCLFDDEREIVKRARNKKSISRPKNSAPMQYKMATAFEALIGYLYLKGEESRAKEIMDMAAGLIEKSERDQS